MACSRAPARCRARGGLQQPACAVRGCPCRSGRCRAARTAWGRLAAQRLREFQVAPGGGGQVDHGLRARHLQLAHVGQRPALGVFGVVQQGRGGGMRLGRSWAPQPARLAVCSCSHSLRSPRRVKGPGRAQGQARRAAAVARGQRGPLALQFLQVFSKAGLTSALCSSSLGPMRAIQARSSSPGIAPGAARPASRSARPGRRWRGRRGAPPAAALRSCRTAARVGQRAGGDHAHHLALHRAFGVAGSPTCSQMATDSPSLMSRAR
jgi:hypothetical protein